MGMRVSVPVRIYGLGKNGEFEGKPQHRRPHLQSLSLLMNF
jgi:hypothetical protein